MSQTVTQSERDPEEEARRRAPESESALIQRQQEAYELSRRYTQVVSTEVKSYFALFSVSIVLIMAAMVTFGATWLFAPVYVSIVIVYVSGALYLFKKLWTY
ncbi:MAG: hypothetical protein OK441_04745 [Thaumarchaeota archaeon]|nr:hypothetical protein [Nitrososphaerota archaeon]